MIAVLVMQRIEAGQWTLRTTIDQVTPGLYPGHGGVTVAQLMNHTSGMPDGIYSLLPDREWYTWTMQDLEAAVVPYHSEQELVELSRRLPWEFEPGTGWSYSNVGYVVLSMMLEAATGSRIQDLVRDRVFKPAKMQQSRLEESTLVRGRYLLPYGVLHHTGASRRMALAYTGRSYVEEGPDPDAVMNAALIAGFRATCPTSAPTTPASGKGPASGGAGSLRL